MPLCNLVPYYRSCFRATCNLYETHLAKRGSNACENERVSGNFAQGVFWVSLNDCPVILPDMLYGMFEQLACDSHLSEFSSDKETNN